jgi:hypothetical protein
MLSKTDEFPLHQTPDTFASILSGDQVSTAYFECAAFGPYLRYGLTEEGGS